MEFKQKFGSWAIVTGASSGIGKEYAKQLAEKGINLILIARRENLLYEQSEDLKKDYNIEIKYESIDLTSKHLLEKVEELSNGLDVGLLISNAGSGHVGKFNEANMEFLEEMLRLNVVAHMKLSYWFTSRLIKQKKKGGLMFTSSTVAYQGTPFFANYSATKAYILNLGEALNYELKDKGINVTVLVPGPTDTPALPENARESMPMKPQSVDSLVKEGLKALSKNKPYQIGSSTNRIMSFILKTFISRKKATKFLGGMMGKMAGQ